MSTPVLRMSEHKCVHTCMNTNSKVHLKMCEVQSAYVFPSACFPSLPLSLLPLSFLLTLVHLKQKAVGVFKVTLVYNF